MQEDIIHKSKVWWNNLSDISKDHFILQSYNMLKLSTKDLVITAADDIINERLYTYDKQIYDLQSINTNLRSQLDLVRNRISADKGVVGENYITDILRKKYKVEDVSKTGFSGDLLLSHNNKSILIEVKNYKTAVPQKETDKFYRDIESNPSISAAVMISLNTKIITKEMFEFDIYENIPIVFVVCRDENIIMMIISILLHSIESEQKITHNLDKISKKVKDISSILDGIAKSRIQILEIKNTLNTLLDKLYIDLWRTEVKLSNSFIKLSNIIDQESMQKYEGSEDDFIKKLPTNDDDVINCIKLLYTAVDKKTIVFGDKKTIQMDNFIFKFTKTSTEMIFERKFLENIPNIECSLKIEKNRCSLILESNSLVVFDRVLEMYKKSLEMVK